MIFKAFENINDVKFHSFRNSFEITIENPCFRENIIVIKSISFSYQIQT